MRMDGRQTRYKSVLIYADKRVWPLYKELARSHHRTSASARLRKFMAREVRRARRAGWAPADGQ